MEGCSPMARVAANSISGNDMPVTISTGTPGDVPDSGESGTVPLPQAVNMMARIAAKWMFIVLIVNSRLLFGRGRPR